MVENILLLKQFTFIIGSEKAAMKTTKMHSSVNVPLYNHLCLTLYVLVVPECVLAISEVPDEIPNNARFHQGLHCLLRKKIFTERNAIIVGNNNLRPFKLYNGPFQVYCFQTEGRIHSGIKG